MSKTEYLLSLKASSLNKENCHLKNCDFIAI